MNILLLVFGLIAMLGKRAPITRRLVLKGHHAQWFGVILLAPYPTSLLAGLGIGALGIKLSDTSYTILGAGLAVAAITTAVIYANIVARRVAMQTA